MVTKGGTNISKYCKQSQIAYSQLKKKNDFEHYIEIIWLPTSELFFAGVKIRGYDLENTNETVLGTFSE